MCGGAIISDFIAVKRGRNLAPQEIWSELDPFSDFAAFDAASAGAAVSTTPTSKSSSPPLNFDDVIQVPDQKGLISYLPLSIFVLCRYLCLHTKCFSYLTFFSPNFFIMSMSCLFETAKKCFFSLIRLPTCWSCIKSSFLFNLDYHMYVKFCFCVIHLAMIDN